MEVRLARTKYGRRLMEVEYFKIKASKNIISIRARRRMVFHTFLTCFLVALHVCLSAWCGLSKYFD